MPSSELFQSTPPRGRRRIGWLLTGEGPIVSIHASAREATFAGIRVQMILEGFNPRLRAGGDVIWQQPA